MREEHEHACLTTIYVFEAQQHFEANVSASQKNTIIKQIVRRRIFNSTGVRYLPQGYLGSALKKSLDLNLSTDLS